MDEAQRAFLEERFAVACAEQPQLRELRDRLLAFGGAEIVVRDEPDLQAILEQGSLMQGPVAVEAMEESSCHANVARLWRGKKLRAIATGYALSGDGLWRQHSWGVSADGLVETTEPRARYFGIALNGRQANKFARSNLRRWFW